MDRKNALKQFDNLQKELFILETTESLLHWDLETYMPPNGLEFRSEQISYLATKSHQLITSKDTKKLINFLKKQKLPTKQSRELKRLEKIIWKQNKLPESFIKNLSKLTSVSQKKWREAKQTNNFKLFQPYLEKIIKLKQKEAKLLNFKGHPYNGLLDNFEEGITVKKLDKVFSELKPELIKIIKKIQSSKKFKTQKRISLKNKYDIEKQKQIISKVRKLFHHNNSFSRIDEVEHPFSTKIGIGDFRITTKYIEKDCINALSSTIHECGHSFYDYDMTKKLKYSILNEAPSMGMHESQSRLLENYIGRSYNFLKKIYPEFKKEFPNFISFSQFYFENNFVKRSLIRIDADEITYCLHIIIRYEIEKGLIEGSIKVKDLPKIWNKKVKEYLNITPKTDTEGCLQDIHWSDGYIGYFPSYAIGSIYAAQIFAQMKKDLKKDINNYKKVIEYLNKKIHQYGRIYTAEELMKKSFGSGLNPKAFINYLTEKYSKIYEL